jgi:hypothetical protein
MSYKFRLIVSLIGLLLERFSIILGHIRMN